MKKAKKRCEKDSMGIVEVPVDAFWGAQTERSRHFFAIGCEKMPKILVLAIVLIKKACALVNEIPKAKKQAIVSACDAIIAGKFDDQFPLSVWQTGSGTQTNMNVNEVIAHIAKVHPNDDVNMSQSTNDVFPSAIHIACSIKLSEDLLPALTQLEKSLSKKAKAFHSIIKVGRTHLMDAAPLTLGQEFSGYAAQIAYSIDQIKIALKNLSELAIGATAVGTGLNAPKDFGKKVCETLCKLTSYTFKPAKNNFQALASSDALVQLSGTLKTLSCSLFKIANDIRWLGSGPRCGLGELHLPENEPGSSIMPGKVNPTQCEALIMVCIQCMGNDAAVGIAGASGNFELNVCRPLIAYSLLQSISLLSDSTTSFRKYCVDGLQANKKQIKKHLDNSLMHATALNPAIGYEMAAKIVQKAHKEGKTIREVALETSGLTEKEFDTLIDPSKMI